MFRSLLRLKTSTRAILLIAALAAFNSFALLTSAQSEENVAKLPIIGAPIDDGKSGKPVISSSLVDFPVGSVGSLYWYRRSPYAPGTTEYCTAITNGSYAQLSFSPNSGFTSNLYNVPFTSDSTGDWNYGRTPDLYIKGIAPINGLAIVLVCPVTTNNDVVYIIVVPAPEPEPSPTINPAMTVETAAGNESTLALNAIKWYKVKLTGLAPNSVGSLRVSEPSNSFKLHTSGQTPTLGLYTVSVQADNTGNAEKTVFLNAVKALGMAVTTEFKYVPATGTSVAKSTSLKAVNIRSIWFERDAGEVPIDNNPHIGGGLRVFPEKKTPTDTSPGRKRVTVKAKVYPAVAGQKVDFRIYDVDDPEYVSSSHPETAIDVDPNGLSTNDNRSLSTFTDSHSMYTSAFADASGIATVVINLSQQPGDNIRVAAVPQGTSYTNYTIGANGVSISVSNVELPLPGGLTTTAKIGLVDDDGIVITDQTGSTSVAAATKMLTTWRRLHLEVDSMGLVVNNFNTATVVDTTPFPGGFGTIVRLDKRYENNRFVGGRAEITKQGITTSHAITTSSTNSIIVKSQLTDDLIGAYVVIYDDDDMNGNDGAVINGDYQEDVPAPNLGWLKDEDHWINNGLMLAYVRPTYDLAGGQSNLPFYLNAPKADLAANDSTAAESEIMTKFNNTSTRNDPEFWTGYILGAYQSFWQGDLDPWADDEANNVDSYIGTTGEFGSIVFIEAVSEQTDHIDLQYGDPDYDPFLSWKQTPLHEVLHLLWADDGDGGTMDRIHHGLSGKTQNKVRNTVVPYMGSTPPLP